MSSTGKSMWNTNGSWPDVSLKQACAKPDEMKRQKATGIDPRQARKAEKSRTNGLPGSAGVG
jgi:hypothetical protein